MWRRGRILGAVGLAVLIVGVLAIWASIDRAHATAAILVRTTIPIDPNAGELLTPPPRDVNPALTAERAYAEYERQSGEPVTTVPADLIVRLGLLTSPIGEPSKLAYGYATPACLRQPAPDGLAHRHRCASWLLVDATTGQMIDEVLYLGHPRGRPS